MKNIKCSVYLINENDEVDLKDCSTEYISYFKNKPKFCDLGDDPSFYCSEKYKSNVTWGVCRHNVRQSLNIKDEVFFVSCNKISKIHWEYFLIGFGEVEDKITQEEIYSIQKYNIFQKYFNLLIKPIGNKYQHWEPISKSSWHNYDWKVRISSRIRNLSDLMTDKKASIIACGISKTIENNKFNFINGDFSFGDNYILFNREKSTFNLKTPLKLCEVNWVNKECNHLWYDENIEQLFCKNDEKNKYFTNKSRQHTVFLLENDKAEKIKRLLYKN